MPENNDEMPSFDIEVITITRTPLADGRYEISINHEGVDGDAAVAIVFRALTLLADFDEDSYEE